ncbi:MAG: HNH endonuclease [Patescibacteria group bacterium]
MLCGNTAKEVRLEIDHITPVVNGGNNNLYNLRTLCVLCNRGKKFSENEK